MYIAYNHPIVVELHCNNEYCLEGQKYREKSKKANSIGGKPTVQGEGQQYREKANSIGGKPTVGL